MTSARTSARTTRAARRRPGGPRRRATRGPSRESACTEPVSEVVSRVAMRHLYADFIDRVAKPMRYLGGEYQAVVKDSADARVCLGFPDVYDIGMSHLGTKIIYSLLNKDLPIADFSSFTPLVTQRAAELRKRGVSMSVASLRAYGLNEDLLDELALTRISGLTFAPEAGTQKMRDVVYKNVTEAHIEESSRRVFSRGWHRLKLYFMLGLPTEEDDDVRGIVETGLRMLKIGRQLVGHRAEVTVSVSSHVPKPHTPLQWAAQDSFAEIERKQSILRHTARADRSLRLKHHHSGISFVEGVLARGDRRIAPVLAAVWRAGARFDGWAECFDLVRWSVALAEK